MGDTQTHITEERRSTSAAAGRPQRLTSATHTGELPPGDSQRSEVTHPAEQAGQSFQRCFAACRQSKMVRLDNLLAGLRQGSNEDSLKTSLGKVVRYLREIKQRYCRTRVNANANANATVEMGDT